MLRIPEGEKREDKLNLPKCFWIGWGGGFRASGGKGPGGLKAFRMKRRSEFDSSGGASLRTVYTRKQLDAIGKLSHHIASPGNNATCGHKEPLQKGVKR